jgi:hypothetical protein
VDQQTRDIIAILQTFGVLVAAVSCAIVAWRAKFYALLYQPPMDVPEGQSVRPVTILKGHRVYCQRPPEHPDVQKFLDTPGFYVRMPDGKIDPGKQ